MFDDLVRVHSQYTGILMSFVLQPVSLDGRILPAPKLLMDKEFEPDRGVWDPRNRQFFDAANLEEWAVANYAPRFIRDDKLRFVLVHHVIAVSLAILLGKRSLRFFLHTHAHAWNLQVILD